MFEKLIIENKKTDAVTSREKEAAWDSVCKNFNAQSSQRIFRNKDSLKKLYENKKKNVRKEAAISRHETYKIDGGPCQKKSKSEDDMLLGIINNKTVDGLRNPFDNDAGCSTINVLSQETILPTPAIVDDESEDLDWGDLKSTHLKSNLQPLFSTQNDMEDIDDPDILQLNTTLITSPTEVSTNKRKFETKPNLTTASEDLPRTGVSDFHRRRRPVINDLHSSNISKQYASLAEVKIEMATLEVTAAKKNEERVTELHAIQMLAAKNDISQKEELHKLLVQPVELDIMINKRQSNN